MTLLMTETDWSQAKLSKSQMQFALISLFFGLALSMTLLIFPLTFLAESDWC